MNTIQKRFKNQRSASGYDSSGTTWYVDDVDVIDVDSGYLDDVDVKEGPYEDLDTYLNSDFG
jgi:hypothetical protein